MGNRKGSDKTGSLYDGSTCRDADATLFVVEGMGKNNRKEINMGLLLTDEEMLDKQFYFDKYTEPKILEGSRLVAKAQLKNIVERLKGYEQTRANLTWLSIPHYDWQALLKEVE